MKHGWFSDRWRMKEIYYCYENILLRYTSDGVKPFSLHLTPTLVFLAPQGCLPLVLMFDIKEDIEVEPQCITALMEQLDVFISIKPKPKQPSKVCQQAQAARDI